MNKAIWPILAFTLTAIFLFGCSKSIEDKISRADRLLHEGKPYEARKIYHQLQSDNPGGPYELYGEGMIDEYFGYDWDAMANQLEAAQMNDGFYPAMEAFTRLTIELDYLKAGYKVAQIMLTHSPDNPTGYFYLGRLDMLQQNFDGARANAFTLAKLGKTPEMTRMFYADIDFRTFAERALRRSMDSLNTTDCKTAQQYQYKAALYHSLNLNDSARFYIKKAIDKDPDDLYLLLDQARYYYVDAFYFDALDVVNEILSRSKDFGRAYILAARIYLGLDEPLKAEQMNQKFAQLLPKSPVSVETMADIYAESHTRGIVSTLYHEAYIKALNSQYPDDYIYRLYFKMINAFFEDRDYAMVVDLYQDGKTHYQGDPELYFVEAELAYHFPEDTASKRYNVAEEIEDHWTDIEWLELAGRFYGRTKHHDVAEKIYRRLVGNPRPKLDYFINLLEVYSKEDRVDLTDSLYEFVPFHFRYNRRLLDKFYEVYLNAGDLGNATKLANTRYQLNPFYIKYVNDLAELKEKAGDPGAANDLYHRYIEKFPGHPEGYYYLAQNEYDLGRTDSVMYRLDKALENDTTFAFAYELRGRFFQDNGQKDSAVANYDKAVALRCASPWAYFNLAAIILNDYGNLDRAAGLAMASIRYFESKAQGYNLLGDIYTAMDKLKLARTQYAVGVMVEPDAAELHFKLGKTYARLDEKKRARESLNKALQLNLASPYKEEARKLLSQL